MSVLLGTEATAGLSAEALGLEFAAIPEGTCDVGDAEYQDNPPREVAIDSFELATTVLPNRGRDAALEALGGQNTVLMFESERDRRYSVVARGTKEEMGDVSLDTLRSVVAEMFPSAARVVSKPANRVGDFSIEGGFGAFNLIPPSPSSPRIIPVTLEAHLLEKFDDANQPALVSAFESSALAALFGLILPTGEHWEVASGDLRDKRYRSEKELRRVAHFYPADPRSTVDVKSKEPNKYGLYCMLGNVREAMANRYIKGSEDREFRGGSWDCDSEIMRAAFRSGVCPDDWYDGAGCRFARQISQG